MKKSRRKTRQCLFQALYSRVNLWSSFDKEDFLESFYDEEYTQAIDEIYFNETFSWIIEKESELVAIVKTLAPKFDIVTMPLINVLPIFIASYEMLYLKCDNVPEKVSIDEALELTKIYSDDNWRIFVNWVLNSLKDKKSTITVDLEKIEKKQFFFR